MSRILIVDDEFDYREQLGIILSWAGHEIKGVASGREAIDVGARFRPDVLIADWMLRNHIHGLHVAEVLRIVCPQMQSILITGFASQDLENEAHRLQIYDFIEKPFDKEQIQEAVNGALSAEVPRTQSSIAVLELDQKGKVVFANPQAREMFADTTAGPKPKHFADLFSQGRSPNLDEAISWWSRVTPHSNKPLSWRLRTQFPRADGSRLAVLLSEDAPQYLNHQLIAMLLEVEEPRLSTWPFTQRVLIADGEELYRRFGVAMLEAAGAGCYGAQSKERALRLLKADEGIGVVLVDVDGFEKDLAAFVEEVRSLRPQVTLVGISNQNHSEKLTALGISLALPKPWRLPNLVELLSRHN
jgi:DNA-binding NtrC family response regulator